MRIHITNRQVFREFHGVQVQLLCRAAQIERLGIGFGRPFAIFVACPAGAAGQADENLCRKQQKGLAFFGKRSRAGDLNPKRVYAKNFAGMVGEQTDGGQS